MMQQVGAFADLGPRLCDRFAHLGDGQPGKLFLIGFVQVAELGEDLGSLVERGRPPVAKGAGGGLQFPVDAVLVERFVFGDGLAGCGILGGDHGGASFGFAYTLINRRPALPFLR